MENDLTPFKYMILKEMRYCLWDIRLICQQTVNNTIIVYGSLQTQFWSTKISIQGTHVINTD